MVISRWSRWCRLETGWNGVAGSILRRQQKTTRSSSAVVVSRLRDDPQALILAGRVRRQDAAPIDHGSVIEAAIFCVEDHPSRQTDALRETRGASVRHSGGLRGHQAWRRSDRGGTWLWWSHLRSCSRSHLGLVVVHSLIDGVRRGGRHTAPPVTRHQTGQSLSSGSPCQGSASSSASICDQYSASSRASWRARSSSQSVRSSPRKSMPSSPRA